MKVLVITGDKNFKPGHERYELQKSAVDELAVVYWGRGSLWPNIPAGHFDVITAQDPLLRGVFALRAAKKMGARLHVQVHMDLQVLPWWKRVLARFVLRHADTVRVVSEKIKQQVVKMEVSANISVLPVYVDITKFKNAVRREHPQKTILWVGRYEAEKDPLAAIAVLEEVRKAGVDAKLVMIGQGSLKEVLVARINGQPVEVLGWQDPLAYLETADVVLCTSLHESWGASIVEALAAGVPVVAPDVGTAKEAGATIVPRQELSGGVLGVLASGHKGQLQIELLPKEAWARKWKETL